MAENKDRKQKQVSLAATAGVSKQHEQEKQQKKRRKKHKASTGTIVVRVMISILVTLSVLFVCVIVFGVLSSVSSGGEKHEVQLYTYDTTPVEASKKVSYFLIGVTGADENAAMDMISLLCYDKQGEKVSILQVPVDMYLGNNGDFTVTRLGNVWNNPTPIPWCETCRRRVHAPEQENGKHTTCGTPLTQKTGSAVENLLSVFNDQFSMPVDNYFILSHQTLIDMVDLVGGIDVELESAMKLAGINYPKGKKILDGKAALAYAHQNAFDGTPAKDIARLSRQRKVWTALLQRMATMKEDQLYDAVISTVMSGANPIRTNTNGESVAKMLAGIHSGSTENVTFARGLCELIHSFRKIEPQNAAFYILPGSIAKQGTATYYSVHKADAVKLLQDTFNPYGIEMKEEHLQITALPTAGKAMQLAQMQTMAELAVEQSAMTTSAPTTTAAQ